MSEKGRNRKHSLGVETYAPILVAVWALCVAALMAPATAQNPEGDGLEQVTLHLKWMHAFQFAGYYAAAEQGYYREEGLDVTINDASVGDQAVEAVLSGDAEYGVWNDAVLNERLSGKPVVVLAVIFQHSPYIVLSRKDAGIRAPSDLIGRKVMSSPHFGGAQFRAMLIHEGLAPDEVEVVSHTWRVADTINGRADASVGYITDQPNRMRMHGVEPSVMRPIDYGIDFYGDCLFTTEAEIEQHPERVAAFRRASLKGWEYAMSHVDEMVELILALPGVQERGLTAEHLRYEAEQMQKLILPKLIEIGHINPGRWKHIADTYVSLGMLDPDYSLEGFVYEPNPPADYRWFYALLGSLAGIASVAVLAWAWNRQLRSAVSLRTRELHESEELYRAVAEDTPVLICRFLPGGEMTYANEAYCNYFGKTSEELVGSSFLPLIPETDRETVMANISAIAVDSPNQSHEHQVIGADGEIRWTRWTNRALFDSKGQPVAYQSIGEDVTGRKQAEQALRQSEARYRDVAVSMSDWIWEVDVQGNYTYASGNVEKVLGYSPEELLGKTPFDFMPPKEAERIAKVFAEIAANKKPIVDLENWNTVRDGRDVCLLTNGVPLLDEEGRLLGYRGVDKDITERKRDEVALRESEERYRELVENANSIIIRMDVEGNVTFFNEFAQRFFGYSEEEIVGSNVVGTIVPRTDSSGRDLRTMILDIGFDAERYATNENENMLRDGTRVWVSWTNKPLFDPAGQVREILCVGNDVTERKGAEEALRESEERFQYLANATVEAILINHKGLCLEANQAAADMFGYDDPSELIGMFGTEVIAPESREIVEAHMLANAPEPYEAIGMRKDGTKFPVAIRVRTMPYKEHRSVRVTALHDISEHKEHERRFQIIAEASADIIYEWDVETDTLLWLGDIDSELGYTAGEISRTIEAWVRLIHPDDVEMLSNAVELHRRSSEPMEYTYRVRHKNGTWRYWHDRGYPVLGTDNLPKIWVGACTDVTVQKSMEDQLRQAQKMEAVGQLAGGVAHDFNNLLQAMNGYAELALRDLDAEHSAHSFVEEMLKAGDRAKTLVRQLLAFSRRQVLDMKDVNLNDVIADLMKMVRRVIGEHITLDAIAGHDLGIVRADPGQIEQILMNLCVNARDAMPEGGTITIETENVRIDEAFCETHTWAKPGRYALLSVTDTGCGMDDETLANVFDPFFTTKGVGEGTGLGLATVYGLVKQHEGMVHVYSEMDKGTTFKIYLPLVERSAATVGDKVEGPVPGGTETILLAEDDEMVRRLSERILEQAGYTVLTAADGEEALRVFEERADEIDLALLDVMMPKLGGRAVYERIREKRPQVRVLFSSGYSMNAIHTGFVLDEGLQLIQKPCQREDLLRRVREVLDGERAVPNGRGDMA